MAEKSCSTEFKKMSSNPEQFSQGRWTPSLLTSCPHSLPFLLSSVLAHPLPAGENSSANDEALNIPVTCLPTSAAAVAAAQKIMIERMMRYDATSYDSLPVCLSSDN